MVESTKSKLQWRIAVLVFTVVLVASVFAFENNTTSADNNSPPSSRGLASTGVQKFSASNDPQTLNIHVVPHTHDDVGWLKTVEEYYYGLNMTIQKACVQDILDTVVEALMENPSRTFTYVEMKFFSMWWNEQNDATKDAVRFLVANQQLSFTNGGWCMHDEASTHFMGMIDQTTLGHEFLKRELGVIPKVGWQLDPFGHSATQASLLTAGVGFDALYFGRIDYQDLEIRHETQECEGLWASSASAGLNQTVFWGLTGGYSGNYQAPEGFCFDVGCRDDLLTDMNRTALLKSVNKFLGEMKVQGNRTKGNHIMITMGSDFNYRRGGEYFANLDLLMGSVTRFQQWGLVNITALMGPRFDKVNIFYSSPEYYTEAKFDETAASSDSKDSAGNQGKRSGLKWSIKKDDFFPYSDCPHCFWTGYFTSRTAFKKLERVASSFLLAARQIESFPENVSALYVQDCESRCDCDQPLYELEDALGVVQHHDAVSGTAKQHVANDYSKRVQAGINTASGYVANKLKRVLAADAEALDALDNLRFCQLLNETVCDVTQEATAKDGIDIFIVVYNGLGSNRSSIIRLPVSVEASFNVTKLGIDSMESSLVRSSPNPLLSAASHSAEHVLLFETGPMPPVGATVFRIAKTHAGIQGGHLATMQSSRMLVSTKHGRDFKKDLLSASNGYVSVHFDRSTGAMTSITTDDGTLDISQTWGYYTSFDASKDKSSDNVTRNMQNSGAYVFRPSVPHQDLEVIKYSTGGAKFLNTSVGFEVHVEFDVPWIKQVTRVLNGEAFVEVEYSVGPIPIKDHRGKEIVTRFSTPIKSNQTFFTDSNGREFLQRRRDTRPSWPLQVFQPVAGNYYPVNGGIYIEDEDSSLAVLVDRTQGGASLSDGAVELMAQRRILGEDGRGVGEPLNETDGGVTPYPPYGNHARWGNGVVVRGLYRIMVGGGKQGARLARSGMDDAFASPLVFAASSPTKPDGPKIRDSFSMLQDALPPNAMLITFKKLADKESQYLVRFGHQFGIEEDAVLSKPVVIDLSQIFSDFKLISASELTLSGNQKYNDWVKRRLDWLGFGPLPSSTVDETNTVITLQPMEIRTFLLGLELK